MSSKVFGLIAALVAGATLRAKPGMRAIPKRGQRSSASLGAFQGSKRKAREARRGR